MDLHQAIEKHAEWKVKFRSAIAKKESMDVHSIAKDNCCDLGKWLHGDAKARYGKLPSYAQCVLKHAAFHSEAGKVAHAINAKNFDLAEAMLGSGTSYFLASSAVGIAISHLRKEIGG
ncbi:MAG TPA: CZB domain-containing protein [Noviherbaspirillum sp.]|nr:CZB domain-containing protein [Noviherbaspirillum sp.]